MSFSELLSVTHHCKEVEIEATNVCNAKCIHCPSTRRFPDKHFLCSEKFNKIIERYNEYYHEKSKPMFIFAGAGEPLINKRLDEFISLCNWNNYKTRIITNASLLNQERLQKLVLSGINEIFISFHSVKKIEYENVMHLNYDNSLNNVCNTRDYLRNIKNKDTKLVVIANELSCVTDTLDEMEEFWHKKEIDFLGQTPIWNRGGALDIFEHLIKDDRNHIKINFELPAWCLTLKYTDLISSTGDFVKCPCDNFIKSESYGNIMTDDLKAIYEKLELILLSKTKPDNCKKCIIGLMGYRSIGRSNLKTLSPQK